GLHPDSNAHAALETRAEALFAEHWIDWWGEVCAAVGLPTPAPAPTSRFGRLARRFGLTMVPGDPYQWSGLTSTPRDPHDSSRFQIRQRPNFSCDLDGWFQTTFRRGFPDSLNLSLPPSSQSAQAFLQRWPFATPLATLTAGALFRTEWPDGPYLAGIHTL